MDTLWTYLRKHFLVSIAASGVVLFGGAVDSSGETQGNGVAVPLIGVTSNDAGIEIVGTALALRAGGFSGDMVISRQGKAGSVSTRQGRKFDLQAGEQAQIARVSISYEPGDRVLVTVTVSRNGEIVAETTLKTVAP